MKRNKDKQSLIKIIVRFLLLLGGGLLVLFFRQHQLIMRKSKKVKNRLLKFSEKDYFSSPKNGFLTRFTKWLKDFFIPHSGNNHRPHILSPRALKIYAITLIMIKVAVVGFLFFTYPNPARLSQKITEGVFNLTNSSRSAEGLPQLHYSSILSQAAQAKAKDMISRSYFDHIGPDGKKPWQWIDKGEYNFLYMGENLAMDFSSADIVHSAFMNSPSHRKNILNEHYSDMGIGLASGEINGRETMVLVEFFGSEKSIPTSVAVAQAAEKAPSPTPVAAKTPTPALESTASPVTKPAPAKEVSQTAPVVETGESQKERIENNTVPVVKEEEKIPASASVATDNPTPALESAEELPAQVVPTELVAEITPEVFTVAATPQLVDNLNANMDKGMVDYVIIFSRYIFLLFLVGLFIALLVNIFVRVHIQHASVIIQSLAVAALLVSFLLVRFHFVESFSKIIIY